MADVDIAVLQYVHLHRYPSCAINKVCRTDTNSSHEVNSLPRLFTVHNQHLATLTGLAEELKSSETSFDDARLTLEAWRDFGYGGERYHLVREWEELVEIETTMGQEVDEDENEDDMPVKRSGKKKGKK